MLFMNFNPVYPLLFDKTSKSSFCRERESLRLLQLSNINSVLYNQFNLFNKILCRAFVCDFILSGFRPAPSCGCNYIKNSFNFLIFLTVFFSNFLIINFLTQ